VNVARTEFGVPASESTLLIEISSAELIIGSVSSAVATVCGSVSTLATVVSAVATVCGSVSTLVRGAANTTRLCATMLHSWTMLTNTESSIGYTRTVTYTLTKFAFEAFMTDILTRFLDTVVSAVATVCGSVSSLATVVSAVASWSWWCNQAVARITTHCAALVDPCICGVVVTKVCQL
jgi:uncharacterized protein YoxC